MATNRNYLLGIFILIMIGVSALIIYTQFLQTTPQSAPIEEGKLEEILSRGRLTIATDPSSHPMSELIPGTERNQSCACNPSEYTKNQLAGFDIFVAVEIARRLGVEPCFTTPAWTQITSGRWADAWDINIGSMTITDDRMEVLYFTKPYNTAAAYLYVHANNTKYNTPEDLSNKRVAVCAGCAQERYLTKNLLLPGEDINYRIHNATLLAYNYETLAIDDLILGDGLKLDAIILDAPIGQAAIMSGKSIRAIPVPLYYSYLAAAIDKKSGADPKSFVNKVSEIIDEMHADGTMKQLSNQVFGTDSTATAALFNISELDQFQDDEINELN